MIPALMRKPAVLARLGATVRRLRRLRGTLGSVGLALALIAGQGGALLHELSHYQASTVATNPSQPASPDHGGKVCDLCLAFAQLAGVVHSDPFASPLLADLRDRAATFDEPAVVAAATPAPRSRGPPSLL